jgi:hypothetical protein
MSLAIGVGVFVLVYDSLVAMFMLVRGMISLFMMVLRHVWTPVVFDAPITIACEALSGRPPSVVSAYPGQRILFQFFQHPLTTEFSLHDDLCRFSGELADQSCIGTNIA